MTLLRVWLFNFCIKTLLYPPSLQAKLRVQNSDGHSLDGTASANDLDDATSLDISTQFETAPSSINPAGFDTASLQSCNSTASSCNILLQERKLCHPIKLQKGLNSALWKS